MLTRRKKAGAAQPAQAIHRFFDEHGFFWVNTPIIIASDAEGAGALFPVSTLDLANLPRTPGGRVDCAQDFFGREAFLTVSGQLNIEAYCLAPTKVYTFGPTFRAENSNTSRHLAEFWMIEPKIAFADDGRAAARGERRFCTVPRSSTGDTAITWFVFPCSPAGRESSRR